MAINETRKLSTPARIGIAKAKAIKEYIAGRNDLYFFYSHPFVPMSFFRDIFTYNPVKNKFVLKISRKEADKITDDTIKRLATLQPSFVCGKCDNEIHKDFFVSKHGKKNGEFVIMKLCRSCCST